MSARRFVDAVVVGAGPAGSAFARAFARQGRSVLILERGEPGRQPVCGGFLGPEIGDAIAQVALEAQFDALPKNPIRRLRVSSPESAALETDLSIGPAFSAERGPLDRMLLDAACQAGAQASFQTALLEMARFSGVWNLTTAGPEGVREISARFVVRASGRRPPRADTPDAFFACKTVYEMPAAKADTVELHFIRRGHVGFNPTGGGRAVLCLHADGRYLKDARGDQDLMLEDMARSNRALASALDGARRVEDWKSCAAEPDNRRLFVDKGMFCAGDAVTMIHPVVGGGIPVAIGSGAALAAILSDPRATREDADQTAERWRRTWEALFGSRAAAAEMLGRAERSRVASRMVFGALAAVPRLLPRIVSRSRA